MKNSISKKFVFKFLLISMVLFFAFFVSEKFNNDFALIDKNQENSTQIFSSLYTKLNIFKYAEAILAQPICDPRIEYCDVIDGGGFECPYFYDGVCGSPATQLCESGIEQNTIETPTYINWQCYSPCGETDLCRLNYAKCGTAVGTCAVGVKTDGVNPDGSWDCTSTGNGTDVIACYAPPVNMVCGTTLNSCAAGTFSDLADSGTTYFWQCNGLYGGYSGMCSLNKPVNGSCGGWVNGCNAGSYSDTADDASYNRWNCAGQYGGSTVACTYPKTNGVCSGTLNTCSAGTFADVTDNSINYLWSCGGANNGTTASCSKLKPPYTPTISNATGHGLINQIYFFDIAGSDPVGYQVKYQTDMDDSAANLVLSEANLNETDLGASGWSYHWGYMWTTPGTRYFRSRTVSSDGRVSPWTATQSVVIHALPTVSLSTSVTSVENNTAATVTWSSTDTTSCSITKNGSAWQTGVSGSAVSTGALTANTTFALNCNGYGGSTANTSKVITIRVNGVCGATADTCTTGMANDVDDTDAAYLWGCTGSNGGSTANCSIGKPPVVVVTANSANGGTTGKAYNGEAAKVTWTATNSPTNCYIYRNGSNIATVSGVATNYVTPTLPNGNTTYRVDCFNAAGTGTGNTVTFVVPTSPTGLTVTCPSPGTTANFSWTLPSGILGTYFRYYTTPPAYASQDGSCNSGKTQPNGSCITLSSGTNILQGTLPNTEYFWYIHAMDAYGNWSSSASGGSFFCTPAAPVVVVTPSTAYGGTTGKGYDAEVGKINWTATNNPTSCTVYKDGAVMANLAADIRAYDTSPINTIGNNYRVECTGPGGTGVSNTVNYKSPLPPTGISATCPSPGTSANFSWTLPSGITKTYFRYYKTPPSGIDWAAACSPSKTPPNGACVDFIGSSITQAMTTNTRYYWYVHAKDDNLNHSAPVGGIVDCLPPPPNSPTIGNPIPSAIGIGTSVSFQITGTDSLGLNITYLIDWDNDGVADGSLSAKANPADTFYSSSYPSGTTATWTNNWSGAGSKTFQVRTQSSDGRLSPWTSKTINVVGPCVPTISMTNGGPFGYKTSNQVDWRTSGAVSASLTKDGVAWNPVFKVGSTQFDGSADSGTSLADTTFTNTCTNSIGQTSSASVVMRYYPGGGLGYSGAPITCGGNTFLYWTSEYASSCYLKKGGVTLSTLLNNPAYYDYNITASSSTYKFNCTTPTGLSWPSDQTAIINTTPLNGSCGVDAYICNAGTSANNVSNTASWTWKCNGGCGGTTTSCTKLKPPQDPVVTGPVSGAINTNYNFDISGYDQSGSQIKYAIDWNNDGVQDGTTALGANGWTYTWVNQWAGAGIKYFKVKTITSDGRESAWATYSFNIISVPALTMTLSPAVDYGSAATLSYTSADATSCTISVNGGLENNTPLNATNNTTAGLFIDSVYKLSCVGTGGSSSVSKTVQVRPSVTITATPSSVAYGATSTIVWSSIYASSCSVTKAGAAWMTGISNAGSLSGVLNANTIFTATCTTTSGATKAASVTVNVAPLNGECATTHYTCNKGTSVNNVSGAMQWTWVCNGANGGTNASCSEIKSPPNVPTITGPASGKINTDYSFNFQAVNTSGDPIRYAIDWDNTGTVDGYLPIAGTTTQGTSLTWTNQWAGSGVKTFKVRTETNGGPVSAWTTWNITLYGAPSVTWNPLSANVPYGGRLTLGYTSADSKYCNLFSTVAGDENTWEATPFWSNASTTFTWTNAGTYEKNFKRKAVCYNPFGDYQSSEFSATVLQNEAICQDITVSNYLTPGQSFVSTVYVNNIGTNPWLDGATLKHRAYTSDTTWGSQYLNLSNGPVNNTDIGVFTGTLTAPNTEGIYPFSFRVIESLEAGATHAFGPICNPTTPNDNKIVVMNPKLGVGTTDIDTDILAFPAGYVTGDPVITRPLTVRNRGGGTLDGTISIAGDKFSCILNCSFSIGPGGSHEATISFASDEKGSFGEYAVVTADGGAQIKNVNLTVSTGDKFTITTSPLIFGQVPATRSKYLTLTIKNNSLTQAGGAFGISANAPFTCVEGCELQALPALSTRTVRFKFNPQTIDETTLTQDVVILSNPNIIIKLEGQGVKPEFKVEEQ